MSTPGVYRREHGGTCVLVYAYEDEETEVADVAALLDLGELGEGGEDDAVLRLTRHELRLLKVAADAHSFDHPAPFIRMCLAVAGQELAPGVEVVVLVSVG